ncbi:hypothetical protein [Micromonospora sp. NPDC049497]|uniref:hypothetical protein n=1 Tax=Micromonospora sp. NPDC049497 TaxID=3364273 RepID=UPI0037AC6B30
MGATVKGIDFYRDSEGYAAFRAEPRLKCLGMWMTGDVQVVHELCLDLLADLHDIAIGRKEHESWEGNAWAAELSAQGVELQNLYVDDLKAHYPLRETQRVVEQYWRLLTDDPDRDRAFAEWEKENGRPHPVVGR